MSNACDNAIEHMYYYLDSEMSWYRKLRIRWHLRRCEGCCSAFEFETKLKAMIHERGRSEPPPELFDTLRALIQKEAADGSEA
ncbi:MAG: zf-HC2 domain-containing protein [Acidimicrobiia bacterium]